jgi:glutamate racemase
MRIALINSGLGLLAAAAALHRMRPDADLVLACDPDGMPWGPRTPARIAERALLCARAAARYEPDVLVMACNTGSVHALEALRAEFEPDIPVIGTVPAIKPAAAAHRNVAIWATVATTSSAYQRRLIAEFGGQASVTPVACPGLADAIDAGDEAATTAAVVAAAAQTPPGCEAVVLGCTEYELAADWISRAVPGAVTFGSAAAVAAQALRRVRAGAPLMTSQFESSPLGTASLGASLLGTGQLGTASAEISQLGTGQLGPAMGGADGPGSGPGTVRLLLSGRPAALPPAALRYAEGRLLAPLVVADGKEAVTGSAPGQLPTSGHQPTSGLANVRASQPPVSSQRPG